MDVIEGAGGASAVVSCSDTMTFDGVKVEFDLSGSRHVMPSADTKRHNCCELSKMYSTILNTTNPG